MTLDIKRFRSDAKKLHIEKSKVPSSRETTGTTKAIRDALPDIYKLREQGVKWTVIAEALAAQGVVQGKGRIPLTANGLTAIVRQVEVQTEGRRAKQAKKADKAMRPGAKALQCFDSSLSAELTADVRATDDRSPQSEDDIRRLAFERVQRMTGKA